MGHDPHHERANRKVRSRSRSDVRPNNPRPREVYFLRPILANQELHDRIGKEAKAIGFRQLRNWLYWCLVQELNKICSAIGKRSPFEKVTRKLKDRTFQRDRLQTTLTGNLAPCHFKELDRLSDYGLNLTVSQGAFEFLVRRGIQKALGARPIKKTVQKFDGGAVIDALKSGRPPSGVLTVPALNDRLISNKGALPGVRDYGNSVLL
jgi:C-terminal, D2-small domain, of ClpB protein